MESSVETYPLPLAYRNLAVYCNSKYIAKAEEYTRKALALDPKDPYNLIFAAAFMAGTNHGDEALKIARDNESLSFPPHTTSPPFTPNSANAKKPSRSCSATFSNTNAINQCVPRK